VREGKKNKTNVRERERINWIKERGMQEDESTGEKMHIYHFC